MTRWQDDRKTGWQDDKMTGLQDDMVTWSQLCRWLEMTRTVAQSGRWTAMPSGVQMFNFQHKAHRPEHLPVDYEIKSIKASSIDMHDSITGTWAMAWCSTSMERTGQWRRAARYCSGSITVERTRCSRLCKLRARLVSPNWHRWQHCWVNNTTLRPN